jgi:hypothetical protein
MIQKALDAVAPQRTCAKLASFVGHINAIEGDIAFVSALNEDTGERFEADCDLSLLRANGIDQGMEFLCTLARNGHQTTVSFSPLPPKVLSEQEIQQILEEVDSKFS